MTCAPVSLARLFGQFGIGAGFKENGRGACSADGVDEVPHLLRRRRRAGADAGNDGADHAEAIAIGEIAENSWLVTSKRRSGGIWLTWVKIHASKSCNWAIYASALRVYSSLPAGSA